MTSVQNRLLPLNGSKWIFFLFLALAVAACSPKLRPVAGQPHEKAPVKPIAKTQPAKENTPATPAGPKVSAISLLLPFDLDHLAPGASYTAASLKEADIALDYYRGFLLALDSLTVQCFNYKLTVYDTRGDKAQSHSLANNPAIRASDLIVGPVFPADMKAFTGNYSNPRQAVVSPLAPSPPSAYKNPQLITMMPPLEYHAWAAAKYIKDKINPQKVFILRSGYSEENDYITPFKKAMDSLSKKHIKVIMLTVVHGQLNVLMPQLSATGKNVFIIPATNQHFLTVTLRSLDSLRNIYPLTVVGHPNWLNSSFLRSDLLQRLDTHITSADYIDFKAPNITSFMQQYRNAYHTEASAFSVKGFDEGLYLGQWLAKGDMKNLAPIDFPGLHNNFRFEKKTGLGWVNTHVCVYRYANFEMKKVE